MNVVWFKKDLRVSDHGALFEASQNQKTVGIYVFEPEWFKTPEYSKHHLQFLLDSLLVLEKDLAKFNIPLIIFKKDILSTLEELKEKLKFNTLFSHTETGLMWTFKRDLKVKSWCRSHSVVWKEYDQFAVIRGLKNRDLWNRKRNLIIQRPLYAFPRSNSLEFKNAIYKLFPESLLKFEQFLFTRNSQLQVGGRHEAKEILDSFLAQRIYNYQKGMSSPVSAFEDCSRLSPYISWGVTSLSEISARLEIEKSNKDPFDSKTKHWFRNLKSFESRLWWHCHFIQKLETEPQIEFQNMNTGFDGMRENDFNQTHYEAWAKGETGFPIIDACMRCLIQTGWINFRMRALLISFSSYQLWLHWKKPAEHLARLFTDFEPGIHYSQIQMQSGVTGINTIRIYSALKQSLDQDPDGRFIKTFCPELESLDEQSIHEPSKAPALLLAMSHVKLGQTYPHPIVDHQKAYMQAKERVFEWRTSVAVKAQSQQVYQKHGSRKNNFFPAQHRKPFGNFVKK